MRFHRAEAALSQPTRKPFDIGPRPCVVRASGPQRIFLADAKRFADQFPIFKTLRLADQQPSVAAGSDDTFLSTAGGLAEIGCGLDHCLIVLEGWGLLRGKLQGHAQHEVRFTAADYLSHDPDADRHRRDVRQRRVALMTRRFPPPWSVEELDPSRNWMFLSSGFALILSQFL